MCFIVINELNRFDDAMFNIQCSMKDENIAMETEALFWIQVDSDKTE